ncbi:MAG: helix-turn-helix domain-containing protein [Spirochaetes bacterium]|nr:helix-turn-helix domain-containing protein [Spirochaetota bacterium]
MGGIANLSKVTINNRYSIDFEKKLFREEITSQIYKILKKENITVKEISKFMDVSEQEITDFISGNIDYSIDKLVELCFQLGYSPKISINQKLFHF